jgi:hypothetical protein
MKHGGEGESASVLHLFFFNNKYLYSPVKLFKAFSIFDAANSFPSIHHRNTSASRPRTFDSVNMLNSLIADLHPGRTLPRSGGSPLES